MRKNIKALSIVRPSGSRIASGEKPLEVRRWEPNLTPSDDLLLVENGRFLHRDGDHDEDGIPVAIVKVKTVRAFTLSDIEAACASYFEEGWLAWELTDVRPVQSTVPVIAARGIYEVDFLLSRKSKNPLAPRCPSVALEPDPWPGRFAFRLCLLGIRLEYLKEIKNVTTLSGAIHGIVDSRGRQ